MGLQEAAETLESIIFSRQLLVDIRQSCAACLNDLTPLESQLKSQVVQEKHRAANRLRLHITGIVLSDEIRTALISVQPEMSGDEVLPLRSMELLAKNARQSLAIACLT